MKDVALTDQADALAKQLSGGQKRKLCVAMALICDPKARYSNNLLEIKHGVFYPISATTHHHYHRLYSWMSQQPESMFFREGICGPS